MNLITDAYNRVYNYIWNITPAAAQPVTTKAAAVSKELFSKIQEDFTSNQPEEFSKDVVEALKGCKAQLINSNLNKDELILLGLKINDLCEMIRNFQSRPLERNREVGLDKLLDDFSFYHKLCANRIRTGSDRNSEVSNTLIKLEDAIKARDFMTVSSVLKEMKLLEIDVDAPLPQSGRSAISLGIKNSNLVLVEYLLLNGANPNQKSSDRRPIAVQAAQLDNMEILAALIKQGADLNVALENEQNILQVITTKKGLNAAIHLIKLGANPALLSEELKSQILNLAIEQADLDIVKKMIDAGVSVNSIPKGGALPPLVHAIELGREEIASQLIDSGADLYHAFNINNDNSRPSNPLNFAIEKRMLNVVSKLVSNGVSPTSAPFIKSPFYLSLHARDFELFKIFVDNSTNLPVEKVGWALHTLIRMQEVSMVDYLIDKAPEFVVPVGNTGLFTNLLEFQSPYLESPLHQAVMVGNQEIVKKLLDKGVDINVLGGSDHKGVALLETPLVTAMKYAKFEIAHFLLDKGADFNQPDVEGNTPYSLSLARLVDKEQRIKNNELAQRLSALSAIPGRNMRSAVVTNMMIFTESAVQAVSMFNPDSEVFQIAEEEVQRKSLAEIFHVHTKSSTINYGNHYQDEITLHGGFADRYWMEMQQSLLEFQLENQDEYDLTHCNQLEKACYNISQNFSEQIPNEVVRLYNKGELVLLNTGFEGHHTSIMLWDGKLILCNRGSGKGPTSFQVYDIPTGYVDLNFIKQLQSLKDGKKEAYVNFFSENNMRQMGFGKSAICTSLENLPMSEQVVGNCSWANSSAQVLPFFVLSQIKKYRSEHNGQEPSVEQVDQFIAKGNFSYSKWESIHKAKILADYMSREVKSNQGGVSRDYMLVMIALVTHFYFAPVVDDPVVENKWKMVFEQLFAWMPDDRKDDAIRIIRKCKTENERRIANERSSSS